MSAKKFTEEERAAMKERAQELKAQARESDVLAKIAEMPEPDRTMGKRLHEIIKASAPALSPKTWYGMPPMPRTARSSASSKRAEVQLQVRDVQLQRRGEPRRRRHVGDLLRA